jgi:hypothetical protein
MKAVAVVLAGLALTACGDRADESTGPSAPSTRAGDAGVTVALPPGWHSTAPDDGAIVEPVTRLVVASAPIRPTESKCQIPAYEFADDAVALVLVEWLNPMPTTVYPERPRHFTSRELSLLPPPAIECFAGSGGSVQFADRGRTFGAYVLAGPRATEEVVEEARQVLETLDVEPAASTLLERNGISLAVPWRWDGRVLFSDEAGETGLIFQVANFELPANEGLEPPAPLPPGEEDPIKAMGPGDVLMMVVSDAPGSEEVPWPVTLDDLVFLPPGEPRTPRAHALAQGSFCRGVRCFRIEVDFGGRSPAASLRAQVDEVLSSLRVEQVAPPQSATREDEDPRGCPRPNWPGPWTACSEAD